MRRPGERPKQDEIEAMIGDCAHRSSKLSDRETHFIDDMVRRTYPLTEGQVGWLEAIWNRVSEEREDR